MHIITSSGTAPCGTASSTLYGVFVYKDYAEYLDMLNKTTYTIAYAL